MGKIRILIVEDNEHVAKCCSDFINLKFMDTHVNMAGLVKDAKRMIKKQSFDLVITDLGLPDQHGEELIKWVKCIQEDTPIIAMSGTAEVDRAKDADCFIQKPFELHKFIKSIKDVLFDRGVIIQEK